MLVDFNNFYTSKVEVCVYLSRK